MEKHVDKQFFGRYTNSEGKTRLDNNLGECIFQLCDKKIVLAEVYVFVENKFLALVRLFQEVSDVVLTRIELSYDLMYLVPDAGELKLVVVNKILSKCVVYRETESSFCLSVVKDGFEHN